MATKKRRKSLITHFKNVAILCLLCYAVVVLVTQQVHLSESKQEYAKVKSEVVTAQQNNDEYQRLLSIKDNNEYMEHIAIERLGYAYPNEKRYYDTSRN